MSSNGTEVDTPRQNLPWRAKITDRPVGAPMKAMNTLPKFPPAIYKYVRSAFRTANKRVCEKLARVPNCPEQSLDMTLIEYLSSYAAPAVVAPGWFVRIDVHFLGGLRHFYNWEIGDIGVLIFAKRAGTVLSNKVAVLQSKRLYPDQGAVIEQTPEDFNIGMGTLLPGGHEAPLNQSHLFPFSSASNYRALIVDDNQYKAIRDYEAQRRIPVHYLLYNPWAIPVTYTFPVSGSPKLGRTSNGGVRVAPADRLRAVLAGRNPGYNPSFGDLNHVISAKPAHASGWRLEYFMADLVMKCQQGRLFESVRETDINQLFYRRSGPIAAAIAVTIEQSEELRA